MRVLLSPAFDGGAWLAPARSGAAVLDEPVVGLAGFLSLLEAQLGLATIEMPLSARVVATAAAARPRVDAFFASSFSVDSIGVARCLLAARDELVLAGLDPECRAPELPPRVADVLRATADVPGGSADRVRALRTLLDRRTSAGAPLVELVQLEICIDGEEELPLLWRGVVASLRARGARVTNMATPAAQANGDLGCARAAPFHPADDGSLLLLRAESAAAAADEVAASLAAHARDVTTLVIGGDSTLDTALARHGAPTLGAHADDGDDELFEVLPLALSIGVSARDPERVLELLSLTLGPVPRGVSRRLIATLRRTPSTHGPKFAEACVDALAALEEPARSRVQLRLCELLREEDAAGGVLLEDVRRRVRVVKRWMASRAAGEAPERDRFAPALAQASIFEQMIDTLDAATRRIAPEELQRLVDEATRRAPRGARHVAKAGVHAVADPGAVVAPIARTIWWGFTRASAELPRAAIAWSRGEREALARLGVELPEASALARSLAQRHARPLEQTTRQLLLVCPRVDRRGDETHPHPLWDEIAGRAAGAPGGVSALVRRRLDGAFAGARAVVAPASLPRARDHWPVPVPVVRALESPTSMERLIGCPLSFVLDTWGLKRAHATLAAGPRLIGLVAHETLARTFGAGPCTATEAEARARTHYPDVVHEQADVLLLPREAFRYRAAAELVARAAAELAQWLIDNRRSVKAIEARIEIERAGRKMCGTPDLVVGDPVVVIDLKTGSERLHEDQLKFGTAIQLAYYSLLLRERDRVVGEDAPWPPVAYFQIGSARMLAIEGSGLVRTDLVRGDSAEHTMRQARDLAKQAFDEIAGGAARAPGAFADAPDVRVPPPCHFCPHDLLCGRALRERERT